jgi:hypothetical protein
MIISTASAGMPLILEVKLCRRSSGVNEVPGRVLRPRVGGLHREGGVCLPLPRGHRDGKVVKGRAQVVEALPDDHRDHRVGLLGHLQSVEPDVALALRLPDPHGTVGVPARVRDHRRLDLIEVPLSPLDLEIPRPLGLTH